jgi:hypothetical protein
MRKQQVYTDRVLLCPDGKYRWIYEFSMMKNPVIVLVVVKIFFWFFFCLWFVISCHDWRRFDRPEAFLTNGKWILILMAVFVVLIAISYTIVAAQNGWKYVVFFELDEDGVIHRQMKTQVKKAKAMSWLTVLAGLATGNVTTVAVGLNSAAKSMSASDFMVVRKVKPLRRWNTIKVNEPFCKNQVYVHKDDFDFVYHYIVDHCPKVKAKMKK